MVSTSIQKNWESGWKLEINWQKSKLTWRPKARKGTKLGISKWYLVSVTCDYKGESNQHEFGKSQNVISWASSDIMAKPWLATKEEVEERIKGCSSLPHPIHSDLLFYFLFHCKLLFTILSRLGVCCLLPIIFFVKTKIRFGNPKEEGERDYASIIVCWLYM